MPSLVRTLTGGSLLTLLTVLISPVQAAETVRLSYRGYALSIDVAELSRLIEAGELNRPFQEILGPTFQMPPLVPQLLTEAIAIPDSTLQYLEGSTESFFLEKINGVIDSQGQKTRPNFTALRTSIDRSLADDGKISLLEFLRHYPNPTVDLDLTQMEASIQKVKRFMDEMGPMLSFAQGFLQNKLCDCPAAAIPPAGSKPPLIPLAADPNLPTLAEKDCEPDEPGSLP
ncbi:alpha/beta hydrolase [Lyngbya confervoides]|uniref:Alpha/beta hydrolase n=1 Tax=Lyngbya confervoides BDU141951 TaxID=1574623 RepID=A0ABD4TB60_9CYAN|nr:alpha/beta hydrolase [Lyngbya confervoides]MCM1985210.1 alpha/beta hydrolase [Lyngbya confervoides BDU141951]